MSNAAARIEKLERRMKPDNLIVILDKYKYETPEEFDKALADAEARASTIIIDDI